MSNSADFHVACARVQQQIEAHLGMQGNLIYDFANEGSNTKLNLITVNARHNQSFLFHTVVGVDKLDALEKMAEEVKPKLITTGASAYPREIDFERMGKIAKKVGAYLFVDMAQKNVYLPPHIPYSQ